MNVAKLARRVRWTLILPMVMLGTTAVLMFLTPIQETKFWATHHHYSDTPWEIQPPARLFAQLLNGPGFYLTFWLRGSIQVFGQDVYDFGRLVGVAIFWTWIGWGLDRRLRGIRRPIIRLRWLRALLYLALLGLAVLFIWAALSNLHSQQMLPSKFLWAYLRFRGLRASVLGEYAAIAWAVVGSAYFGKQLLTTLKAYPLEETVAR